MKLRLIFLLVLISFSFSCKKDSENSSSIKKEEISGYVQKGPFVNGTSVQMYELNTSLEQTGKSFNTQIVDNKGTFSIQNIALSSQYVEFFASGYYFNEFTGEVSPSPLSLYAVSDIKDINTVNVNILTHLERSRVKYLINKGLDFATAKDSAQKEILRLFGLTGLTMQNSEKLDISQSSDQNAVLLAISLILQGNRSVGDLTELLANLSADLQQDGIVTDPGTLSKLRSSATLLNPVDVRTKLQRRYQDLGINATIPNFGKYLESFLSFTGLSPTISNPSIINLSVSGATINVAVNANDLGTSISLEYGATTTYGNIAVASPSNLTGHALTSVTVTLNSLNPSTTYHCRVVATNSKGTTLGNDITFTTTGSVPVISNVTVSNIISTGATLTCSVNGNKLLTTVGIEFGTDTSYGQSIVGVPNTITESGIISANLQNLQPGTTYHFRMKAVNSLGTIYSNDMSFTTLGGIPIISNPIISNQTISGAVLSCTINGNYVPTTVVAELGTTISYGQTIEGSPASITGTGSITMTFSNLSTATLYHYRLKASNMFGTVYTEDKTFMTSGSVPSVGTITANITFASSFLTCFINANGLLTTVVVELGTDNTYGQIIEASPSTITTSGNITANLSSLLPSTLYYCRVRATNSLGTSYSESKTFMTAFQLPVASIQPATNVLINSATLNGIVNAKNNRTEVVFEYGTDTNYGSTVGFTTVLNGLINTPVTITLNSLIPNTVYHYRIKAMNVAGITYTNDMTFTTIPSTVSDIEGNIYKVVEIGTQAWMAENLKTTKYNNATGIFFLTGNTDPAFWWYNNDIANKSTYGALYSEAVVESNGNRNVCPTGWHIPSVSEWSTVINYLGGLSVAGGKLKQIGTSTWASPNIVTIGQCGFEALPGGTRYYDGSFQEIGTNARFMTSNSRYYIMLYYDKSNVDINKYEGTNYSYFQSHSIRCIKD